MLEDSPGGASGGEATDWISDVCCISRDGPGRGASSSEAQIEVTSDADYSSVDTETGRERRDDQPHHS